MSRPWVSLSLMLVLCAGPAFAADKLAGTAQSGYRRLGFTLDSPAKVTASATGGVLTVAFDRKPSFDVAAFLAAAPGLIASGHADADGKTFRFALSQPVKLHQSQQGLNAVVDLAPADFAGAMPDLAAPKKAMAADKPADPSTYPEIKLRAGTYSNFTRLVFDWRKDVPYTVVSAPGKLTMKFGAPAHMDLSFLTRFPTPYVKSASWQLEGGMAQVEILTDSDSGYHDFRDGAHVVLDILAPKTDAGAYTPPGTAKPAVTKMTAAGAIAEQSKIIADASAQLAGKKPVDPKLAKAEPPQSGAKNGEGKPDPKNPDVKTPEAKAPEAKDAKTADTVAQVTGNGASLTFRDAGAAAVFVRGVTAWIVLENSPPPDIEALRKSLNGFATGVEAAVNPGLTVLRIGLKSQAKIVARSEGGSLRVLIGGDASSDAATIAFVRNQADPRRTSLTTTLPRADKAFELSDPASGDVLTVVPSATGYGVPVQKNFADFAALPSAQGLVIASYTDDLNVDVAAAHVTIARPGGMALTPPQMASGSSPAALAHMATGGPTFLDLAKWGQAGTGFLATQRALNHDIASAPPSQMNSSRLKLARFYLAQGFGAEALGLLNLIQNSDPSLKGDIQLSTMRAAADIQLGRYRDAHNELTGPLFDNDRNAALWRGLADAGMENWKLAHDELEAADEVLARYPAEWQGRALLANAKSSLEQSRLDIADAALQRLPKTLPKAMELEAKLDRARIGAAEGHFDATAADFAALEKSGDERIEAEAVYYYTEAALNAGTMKPKVAIDALERLRYRWRGDGLELKTLRKLASLYFKAADWQNGLNTLAVATQNFSGDASRAAQDDMRGAFTDLYLKGGADKLPPIQSLSMFYDNKDLIPIGPDGDEMIRRMADRLIAVDLLAPATTLLAHQVNNRLQGIAKAQVATRLAAVQLMDAKPADAINTLRTSEITGLPEDVVHGRLIIEARAFAALKQFDNALDLIAVDQSAESRQMRADLYWDSGNWAVAGQKIEELLAGATPALTEAERMNVLRAATAYSLANDEKSLARLSATFAPRLKGTPDAGLFAVLVQPIETHGLAFRDAAAKIASVDTLKSFMSDYQKKFSVPVSGKAS